MKKIVILKESKIKIAVYNDYMVVTRNGIDNVVALRYIKELYLNKTIELSLSACVKLAKQFPLFLTDHNGYVIAEVKKA